MRVGITGGSGFIGSHVVDKLRDKGHEVVVYDIKESHRKDVEHVNLDILNIKDIIEKTKNLDAIYHLAAVANVNDAYADPIFATKLNIVGTTNILEAARQNKIGRTILASTVWVYGGCVTNQVTEDSPFYMPGAGHLYTTSKIASEFLCHDYKELYDVDFTILRYGIPYGPRARVGTVMPIFLRKVFAGEPLTIHGDGKQFRNFLYVEDLAEGNVAALKEIAKNKTYNLPGKRPVSVLEIAETIRDLLEGVRDVKIEFVPARPGDYKGKTVHGELAKNELSWEPKIEFREGMKRYIEWYKSNVANTK